MAKAFITHRVRGLIDKCAENMVLMERGEYEFPDGKPRWAHTADGQKVPRVVNVEAQRAAWGKFNKQTYAELFSAKGEYRPILEERLVYHRRRMDDGYKQALAVIDKDGAFSIMTQRLYESLMEDLLDERKCARISFRDRAKFFEVMTKLDAAAAVSETNPSGGRRSVSPTVVVQQINVPDSVKERMRQAIDGEAEEVDED